MKHVFSVLGVVAASALLAPTVASGHPDATGYAPNCLEPFKLERAIPGDETSYGSIGLRNTCDFAIVATFCSPDGNGGWIRYAEPVNLWPSGGPNDRHSWTNWENRMGPWNAAACKTSATCQASLSSHDPHC